MLFKWLRGILIEILRILRQKDCLKGGMNFTTTSSGENDESERGSTKE